MKVKEFIETNCDEDELFVIKDYEDEDIARIWKSDYRINKEKYNNIVSMELESWSSEMTHTIIWVK